MVRGEGSHGVADSIDNGVDVTRIGSHDTSQERVAVPRQRHGSDHHGSASLGRMQSNSTDEPRSIAQAERKPDENYSSERIEHSPNTLKVTTNAGLVVGNEQMRRMLYGANARDATAPSTIVSTSTDCDERKSDENDNPKRIERSSNTPKVITSAGRSPNTANITTSAGRSPNTPNVATSAVRSPNAPNIATSAGRSPDTPKVTTSVGLVDRTELRRRMLYNADAGDSTAPSTWTTFTTSTDSDERKSEENDDPKHIERSPNTPKVTTSAGLVDRTEVTKRVLPSANAGDATAPSTTSTTSTDRNDQGGYAEDDELEQLLGSGRYSPPKN